MIKLITAIFFCMPLMSSASPTDRLIKSIMPKGSMYNKNHAAIIKDQSGGYMTGGSLITRGPIPQTLNPLSIQTPSFKFDPCTGSGDFRFGGFSFVSSKEMVQFFQKMAQSFGFYATKMFIKNKCPQCETVMTELEGIARQVSQFNLEQCSLAQNLAGGLMSKLASSDKQRCLMQDSLSRSSSDLAESTRKCTANPDVHDHLKDDEEMQSLLGSEFNLVWKALNRGSRIIAEDKGFAEMIMSISGTIIGNRVDGRWRFTRKESLFQDNDQLAALMGLYDSSSARTYKCNEYSKCLHLTEENINLGEKPLYHYVASIIKGLTIKVARNLPENQLTDDERSLINFSSIPIINLIEQELIQKGQRGDVLVSSSEFIELICYDMITEFLTKLADIASRETKSLELGSNEPQIIESFIKDLDQIKNRLYNHKMTIYKKVETIMHVKESLELQKNATRLQFSKMLSKIN